MKKIEKAWMLYLSSIENISYLYMIISIYKQLKDTNTKYPIYCGVTNKINESTRSILEKIGLNLLDLDTSKIEKAAIVDSNNKTKMCAHYKDALTKLAILNSNIEEKFDKIVYIDSDYLVYENMDELFDKPHMSAVEDELPAKKHSSYKVGDSIFCAGLLVWDFNQAKELNQTTEIFELLSKLPEGIQWNDQNILNYYFRNWINEPSKHLDWTYGLMCEDPKLRAAGQDNLKKNSIKVMHFVSDAKNKMPFETIIEQSDLMYPYIKSYFESVNEAVKKINNLNLEKVPKLPLLKVENIRLKVKEKEPEKVVTFKADGFTGLTEEWWKEEY